MYCTQCGIQIDNQARFCSQCGHATGLGAPAGQSGRAKRLYRAPKEGKIGGVCAGLAEYMDVDVTLIRVAVVALAIFTAGLPVVLGYIFAWIIMPRKEEPAASAPVYQAAPASQNS